MMDTSLAGLDDLLGAAVERGVVPGVSAIVVDRDGVRWQGAHGVRSLGGDAAMTVDTIGAIYSMTKPITGAAALHAVEAGLLQLDAPAGGVLDELADPQVLAGFDGDGRPMLRPAHGAITLRNLLTHTSGFVYDLWNADLDRWYRATDAPDRREGTRAGLRTPLMFDPGERWEYGTGIDWVGLVIEAASGQTLGDYFREHLLEPMGMPDTMFPGPDMPHDRLAGMHRRRSDGELTPVDMAVPEPAEYEAGGGGLYSTIADYGRFLRMMIGDGSIDGVRVLSPETVATMAQNHIGKLRVTELPSSNTALSNDAELFAGEEKSWGLTFQVHEQPGFTGRPAGTLTWAGLSNCYFWIDRANGIAGAYMTQLFPFADHGSLGLYYDFERAVYAALG